MNEVFVKHNGYYIQETVNGYVRVKDLNNATDWGNEESATKFIDEINLNANHCIIVKRTYNVDEYILVQDQWLGVGETEQCTECLKRFPLHELYKERYSHETDLEYRCEEHRFDNPVLYNYDFENLTIKSIKKEK